MNVKPNTIRSFVLFGAALGLATASSAKPTFYLEAGASHFALRDAELYRPLPIDPAALTVPVKVTTTQTKSKVGPLIAAGAEFNAWFGLRLSYQQLRGVRGLALHEWEINPPERHFLATRSEADVHVTTISPEFRRKIAANVEAFLRPELAWVVDRSELRTWTNLPAYDVVPYGETDENGFTVGGSAGLVWHVAPQWALSGGYQYVDLDPSSGRVAHVLSAALRFKF